MMPWPMARHVESTRPGSQKRNITQDLASAPCDSLANKAVQQGCANVKESSEPAHFPIASAVESTSSCAHLCAVSDNFDPASS